MSETTTFVIFGASGDLAHRKLIPALYNLTHKGRLPADFRILGVATRPWSDDDFRAHSLEGLTAEGVVSAENTDWRSFASKMSYLSGNFNDGSTYKAVASRVGEAGTVSGNLVYYLATPPEFFLEIISGLEKAGLLKENGGWRRVVIEKPFGTSLETARNLNERIHQVLREDQVFRIDHYLGKETVQNILVARFANTIFEPIWNRNYIDNVQITVAETVGVETRGKYYDKAGVIRDMFQNHLLQLLTLVAMEPTSSYKADALRDEKLKVISAIRPIRAEEVGAHSVVGQYNGYLSEMNVAPGSKTATFAALRLYVDNWRWQGVPFYLRSGKKMEHKISEIIIQFKNVPHRIFPMQGDFSASSNLLSLSLQPDEGIHLSFAAKVPGSTAETRPVTMDFYYRDEFGENSLPEAYERLLLDVTLGDASLFIRADQTELSWQLMDPILQGWESPDAQPPALYESGSWGPASSVQLLAVDGSLWDQACGGRCTD
jgi:glucose-6-phosphate 1-dehydrogenase